MESHSNLLKQRAVIKGKLTRNQTFYDSIDRSNIDEARCSEILRRMNNIEQIFNDFNEIQLIIEQGEVNLDDENEERDKFEKSYYSLISQLEVLVSGFKQNKSNQSEIHSLVSRNQTPRVNLPAIKLPKFNGDYSQWLDFKEAFTGLIHSNSSISNYEKFCYLRSSLEGDACKTIEHLKTAESTYNTAWQKLSQRYDNHEFITNNHLKALFDQKTIERVSATNLRQLFENLSQNLRALELLGEPVEHWTTIIIYLITSKLDSVTLNEWEQFKFKNILSDEACSISQPKKPTLQQMFTFLEQRCQILEKIENRNISNSNQNSTNIINSKFSKGKNNLDKYQQSSPNNLRNQGKANAFVGIGQVNCYFCNKNHLIYYCQDFLKLNSSQRNAEIKAKKLCENCLRSGHSVNNCSSSSCKKCGKRHNSLLHFSKYAQSSHQSNSNLICNSDNKHEPEIKNLPFSESSKDIATTCNAANISSQPSTISLAILSTAIVKIQDKNGKFYNFRALLDNGAQNTFVSENLCRTLNLDQSQVNFSITGVGQVKSQVKHLVNICLFSNHSPYKNTISCLVLPTITGQIPTIPIDPRIIPNKFRNCLADPQFYEPGPIDILLGSNIFWDLITFEQKRLNNGILLQKTHLGWIVSGNLNNCNSKHSSVNNTSTCYQSISIQNDLLHRSVERFWEVENIDHKQIILNSNTFCENHFSNNFKRNDDGNFIVSIPFKNNLGQLGNSKDFAIKRFLSLEKRLIKNQQLYIEYRNVINEYLELGHMTKINNIESLEDELNYYLPHHAIIKDSLTTRLRIVFDASMKSDSGLSLNNVQHSGPVIQNDLFSIILRFRKYQYVITADISKMYRMIFVHENDRKFQRIFWRNDISDEIQCYEINRVVFGTASAPYLAIRCLYQLGIECETLYPEVSNVIKNDFYVDDCLTGCNSESELLELQRNLSTILATGGFQLRKWRCNKSELCQAFQVHKDLDSNVLQIGDSETNKTLGILWNSNSDTIQYSIANFNDKHNVSKRTILSEISQIFDPLGLLGPIVIVGKILIQELWIEKLDWDTPLPLFITQKWTNFRQDLTMLKQLIIPRQIVTQTKSSVQLHGFSDSSEKAYGATIYIRVKDHSEKWSCNLLCAKSRVAPIKRVTLPRLELCGAHLLAQLVKKVTDSIDIEFDAIHLWSDSTITLSWIQGCPSKWKTFVANRVSEIQRLTSPTSWHHVKSLENPADIISRGCTANDLINSTLWWSGPPWLISNEPLPIKQYISPMQLPEQRIILCVTFHDNFNIFDKFSSLKKLQRVMAYVLRFINNLRAPRVLRVSQAISVDELNTALTTLIKLAQKNSFFDDYNNLFNGKSINKQSNLLALSPFLDNNHLMRVGGRIQKATISFDKKHPIILPAKHNLSKLIMTQEHVRLLHCGASMLFTSIRENYWPIAGRNLAKQIVHRCITCFRAKPKAETYQMGNLPKCRINQSPPFYNTGLDYAGPFLLKDRNTRNAKIIKGYVCLFICMATKAIHLEVVSDLTTDCFIAAFRRFVSRRGKPLNLYSDNAKTFIGAQVQLKDMYDFFKRETNAIQSSLADEGVSWNFIPPRAPNFGGIWEAGIKSAKFHLKRVIGEAHLTFEGFSTVLTQIEAILNSRPLYPINSDPNQCNPLTPAHFLVGRSLTAIPDSNIAHVPENRLKYYQRLQKMVQHFWKRWHMEYLSELQLRVKWKTGPNNTIKIDTVVLVKDDNAPPMKWSLGRVVELHPGSDNIVRVVSLMVQNKIVKRPISKLCIFPFERDNIN